LGQQVRRLLAEAQALSARLAALNEIATAIQVTLDTTNVFQTLANQARWLIDFQHCSVAIVEEPQYQVLTLRRDQPPTPAGRFPLSEGIIGRALRNRHEIRQQHLTPEPGIPAGMQSALIVPLRSGAELIGTINFFAANPEQYSLDDLRVAAALAAQVSVSLQNARLHDAVIRARDELHTVLESIGDAVLVLDRNGRILLLNNALRRLFGMTAETTELGGKRGLTALWHTPGQRSLIERAELHALLKQWAADPGQSSTGNLPFTDGRHVEWARAPLIGSGDHQGAVITLRDISARVALEQLRADMTSLLVHDLRTPLTSIMMGLDLMQAYRDEPELYGMAFTTIQSASRQMLDHVNTILDLSRLETGQLDPDRSWELLPNLIDNTLAPLRALATQSQQTLQTQFEAELPLLPIDRGLIGRVLSNLVGNALKFSPMGAVIVVGAQLNAAAELVEVWVQDSGPGIPPAMRTQIFEKYAQVRREDRRRGSGMGLFFCRLAVEAHGGRIGVREGPQGVGSVFWFTLPM
jgi:PAS domain S-box-containing protein